MAKRTIALILLAALAAACLCAPAMASAGPAQVKNGLVTGADGKVYCYADGRMLTGIQTVNGRSYYFSVQDGHRMAGGFVTDGKQRYYADARDGHLLKGCFVTVKGERYYLAAADGHVMKGGFITDGGRRYYLDKADGHVHSGEFVTVGSRRYFLSPEDGHCLTGCVIEDRGQLYYLAAADGHVMCGGWISAASGRYYAGEDGALYTGVRDVGGETYCFDPNSAWLRRGLVLSFGDKLHFFDAADGHMVKGGWAQGRDGRRYYAGLDGALVTGRVSLDGATYVFDERDGHLIEGPIERLPLENQDLVHRLSQESRGSCLATSFSMAANLVLGWDKYGAFDWCAPGSDAANISQYNTLEGTDGYIYRPAIGGYSYDALVRGIEEAINGGWPIVVSVRGTSTASTHYVLLVGWTDASHTDYLIVDPAGGGTASIAQSAVAMRGYRHYELGNRNGTYMYVSFTRSKK